MENMPLYNAAHLVVAAVRIAEYRDQQPPSVETAADLLAVSAEDTYRICRKLENYEIIRMVSGGYGVKIFIHDHTAIESLSQESPESDISHELEKFKEEQKQRNQKIAAIKQKEEERKKILFDQLEQQFKEKQTD